MRFSVLIPAHRWHKFLPACIASVTGQSHEQFEIIISHPENCGELLWGCKTHGLLDDPRIRLVNCGDAKTYGARAAAISDARGDYLLFLDSDDMLHPRALETLAAALTGCPTDLLFFDTTVVTDSSDTWPTAAATPRATQFSAEKTTTPHTVPIQEMRRRVLRRKHIIPGPQVGAVTVRRNSIHPNALQGNPQMLHAEDKLLLLELLDCATNCAYLPQALYAHRKLPGFATISSQSHLDSSALENYEGFAARAGQLISRWQIPGASPLDQLTGQYVRILTELTDASRLRSGERRLGSSEKRRLQRQLTQALCSYTVREIMRTPETVAKRLVLLSVKLRCTAVVLLLARFVKRFGRETRVTA